MERRGTGYGVVAAAVAILLFAAGGITWWSTDTGEAERVAAQASPGLRLVANLPAYRLDVYEDGALTRSYPIAIGKPTHRTPRGTYRITHVDWNPWWHPPDRPWARGARVTPPGANNPMGRAKLYFRDLYYLHGTPAVNSLGSAASHGCVRLRNEDVVELARLVHRYGSPGVSSAVLDRLESNPRQTRTIRLDAPVRLELVYEVAEVRNGQLELHPDVYGLVRSGVGVRERAIQALLAAGYDPARLNGDRLEELLYRSRQRMVTVPVESVLVG